jgi:hypothetical protein
MRALALLDDVHAQLADLDLMMGDAYYISVHARRVVCQRIPRRSLPAGRGPASGGAMPRARIGG